ncbi:hypothetical protein Tco_1218471 [Tanacetum coccineum]
MDGYVMPKYEKTSWREDDSWSDIILDDIYNPFYKDKDVAKEADVAKEPEATNKDYTKLQVTDEMLEYVFAKYRNKWHLEDDIADVILEDLWIKYGKYDKRKRKVHDLDLENRIKKLEVDFGRMIKAKQAKHDQFKVNKDDNGKGKMHDLDLKIIIEKLEVDFARMIKAKEIKQVEHEVIEISSDEDVSSDEDPKDPKLPRDKLLPLPLPMHKLLQLKIAMTGCVLGLRAHNDPNALTSALRKRKSKKP